MQNTQSKGFISLAKPVRVFTFVLIVLALIMLSYFYAKKSSKPRPHAVNATTSETLPENRKAPEKSINNDTSVKGQLPRQTDGDNDQPNELDNEFALNTESEITDALVEAALQSQLESDNVTPESAVNQTTNPAAEPNQSIIEDLSFAGAQDSDAQPGTTPAEELYCLNTGDIQVSESLIKDGCQRISNRLASVSMSLCETAELAPTGCESVDGFPLLVSKFPPLETRKPQGRILVLGGMHGDELTSVSMVFRWIADLKKHHSGLFHWHMAPMMNPDGVLKKGATRTNKNGVDLNRNMPSDDWETRALQYWKEKVGSKPRRYPGKSAASEPETQWLIDEINTFKPDAIISVHAPYGVVDFDALVLNTAPKSLGKLHLNLLGTYPGSLGNYAGINRNIPVITLELPHAWEMPSLTESAAIWNDMVRWLRKNVNNDVSKDSPPDSTVGAKASEN